MKPRKWTPAILLLIIVGFGLRLYHLGRIPFRGDEAFTVQNWMMLPLSQSLTRIATVEPHPFLTYVLFRTWGLLAGATELAARFLPALVNTLGIPAIYVLGTRLLGRRGGVLAALCWTFHPFLIWHSQDARNYALWSAISVLALWLGLRAVERDRVLDWIFYGIIGFVAASIFYFELFMVVAFAFYVFVIYWKKWQLLLRFVGVQVFVVVPSVISFLFLQGTLVVTGGYGGTTGSGLDFSRLFTWFLPVLMWGETLPIGWDYVLAIILTVVFLIAFVVVARFCRSSFTFLFFLSFIPLALLSVLSLKFDIFAPRYILSVIPIFILLLVVFLLQFHRLFSRPYFVRSFRFISSVFFGMWFLVAGIALYNYWFVHDYAKSKDWPNLTDYLEESRVTPQDIVIQLSVDPAFGFYYDGVARDEGLPANPQQPTDEIVSKLSQFSRDYQSIWLVGQTFPDWSNYGVVEGWLHDKLQLVRDITLSDLHVQQFMPWQVKINSDTPLAKFGDVALLVSADVLPAEPNGDIPVWVYWQPTGTTNTPYKVFLHLTGEINPATGSILWAQDDQFPQNGRISTTNWDLAAIYRDIYVLPGQSVPPGEYELQLGFYDPDTGNRLLQNGEDSYRIQSIKLP